MRLSEPLPLKRILSACSEILQPSERVFLPDLLIYGFAGPEQVLPDELCFLAESKNGNRSLLHQGLIKSPPAALLAESVLDNSGLSCVTVISVYRAMDLILRTFAGNLSGFPTLSGFDSTDSARIKESSLENSPSASLHRFKDIEVGFGTSITSQCSIGSGSKIGNNVVIEGPVKIGKNCNIQSGVTIGVAGFGFYEWQGRRYPLPHFAGVEIGDDVWVGANTVIAAGVLHPTRIGNSTIIDSLVQIAHNVEIGEGCAIASQAGIAGSTKIGNRVQIGGQAGIAGHIQIGDSVVIAAQSGVTKSIPAGLTVAGFPAEAIETWRKKIVLQRTLAKGHFRNPKS